VECTSSRYHSLHRSTLSVFLLLQRQPRLFSSKTARAMPFKLPTLPDVPGTDPSRAVLDSFKVAIPKRVADALPPLTVEQVYQGVDYGKKGVNLRSPSTASVSRVKSTCLQGQLSIRCEQNTLLPETWLMINPSNSRVCFRIFWMVLWCSSKWTIS
jgi:hypothetical protein